MLVVVFVDDRHVIRLRTGVVAPVQFSSVAFTYVFCPAGDGGEQATTHDTQPLPRETRKELEAELELEVGVGRGVGVGVEATGSKRKRTRTGAGWCRAASTRTLRTTERASVARATW